MAYENASLVRQFEHTEGYLGPRSSDKQPELGKDTGKKTYTIKSIHFFDKTVRSTKSLLQAASSLLANDRSNLEPSEEVLKDTMNAVVMLTDTHVMVWDYIVHTWNVIEMLPVLGKQASTFECFSDTTVVAFGCADGSVRLFDTVSWTPLRRLVGGHSKAITRLVGFDVQFS